MSELTPYDINLVPVAVGFNNTGVICYANSILQLLISCPSFAMRVIAEPISSDNPRATIHAMKRLFTDLSQSSPNVSQRSADIVQSLVSDIQRFRPGFKFGRGQESSSEMFIFIIDMLESPGQQVRPITELFMHRYSKTTICNHCRKSVSVMSDYAINFNMFYYDMSPPKTPEAFSALLMKNVSKITDFNCPECKTQQNAIVVSQLKMLPEIIVIMFNIYRTENRQIRYFPLEMSFPSSDSKYSQLTYQLVAQVEHSGTLNGGHYWARCKRSNGVFVLNDNNVTKSASSTFAPTVDTYIIAYHYVQSS